MIEAVFLIAIVAGGIAALAGNRAAIALLAGTAFTAGLVSVGMAFNLLVWMLVDLCVVVAIVHPRMRVREVIVVALFFPLWATYFVEGEQAWQASALISATQFLLTFPIFRTAESGRRLVQRYRRGGGGMAFIAHQPTKEPAHAWTR